MLANLLSILGSALSMVAIPWFVLEFSGDIVFTSYAMAIKLVPHILSLFLGVQILDKYPNRTICILSDLLSGVFILLIPILFYANQLNLPILLFLICASSMVDQINHVSMSAMVPEVIKANNSEPEKFNGILGSIHNMGDLLGPILAGLLISYVGNSAAFVVDGMSFFVSALIFTFLFKNLKHTAKPVETTKTPNFQKIMSATKFIFQHEKIKHIASISIAINFLIMPLLSIVLPYLAQTKFGNALDLGFLFSVFGVGTFISSLSFTFLGAKVSKRQLVIICCTVLISAFALGGYLDSKVALYTIMFAIGLSIGFLGPLDDTILQKWVPEAKRGIIFMVYASLRFITIPLSMILFGFVLKYFSIQMVFITMALILLLPASAFILSRVRFEEAV